MVCVTHLDQAHVIGHLLKFAFFEIPGDFKLFNSRAYADNEFKGGRISWISKKKKRNFWLSERRGWEWAIIVKNTISNIVTSLHSNRISGLVTL